MNSILVNKHAGNGVLSTCQPGYEAHFRAELAWIDWDIVEVGSGWIRATPNEGGISPTDGLCFRRLALVSPEYLRSESINAVATELVSLFGKALQGVPITQPWPLVMDAPSKAGSLVTHTNNVRRVFLEKLGKKLSRVRKLATTAPPAAPGRHQGWCVALLDFHHAAATTVFEYGGQCRMADDPRAPSRSYLKVEEAYRILERGVEAGETVVDLGAAPGGWSYSAAKRGARVVAVDNGPLKKGAANHPQIQHRRTDAFTFRPAEKREFDWLFCDTLEEPSRVIELLKAWLANHWCQRFVVNIKFGHLPPIQILQRVFSRNGIAPYCERLQCRHLYHDRDELTLVGTIKKTHNKDGSH